MIENNDGVKNSLKNWFFGFLNRAKNFIAMLTGFLGFVWYISFELCVLIPDGFDVWAVIGGFFFISVCLFVCVNLVLFILNLEDKKRFVRQTILVLWVALFCCYLVLILLSFWFPSDYGSVFGWSLDFGITCLLGLFFYVLGWLGWE